MADNSDNALDAKISEWLAWDKNDTTRAEMQKLVKNKDFATLRRKLSSRLEFGTAGLRAPMGAGYALMNDLTIIQTTQGFSQYMLKATPSVKKMGVVIGHDARHNSHRFALLAATVLLNQDIPVYLFSQITPTPYVPYSVLQLGCAWGIMVTASHNPKEDNGYKVYFENGAQIISPHDKGIASTIQKNLEPLTSSWDTDIVSNSKLRKDPFARIHASYMDDLKKLCYYREQNSISPLKFTYTAMHGVGYKFITEAFKAFNFAPCVPVVEQVGPDPDFPTVRYPNPEEGKSAMDLAMKTASANGSTVILANDPDADRLALAEKQPDGSWHVFTGNEIGGVIGWWLTSRFFEAHPNASGSNCYCMASAVSSKILQTMAWKEGYNFVETLTGFKWMGNKAVDLMNEGKTVLFAFEEAIGFMCGTTVLDKDGVSAAMVVAEMASHLAERGETIKQTLDNIYDRYGHHISINSYFLCHEPPVIERLFDRLRNYGGTDKYPSHCGSYAIKYTRDLTTGYDNSQSCNKAILPTSKSSQMITFTFENGCVVTLRTSGTEPKIKYYTELIADADKGMDRRAVEAELQNIVSSIIENFLEPSKNNLIAKSN